MLNCKNKKGQIGETISWIIATILVIGILIIFIYISVLISKTKTIGTLNLKTDFSSDSELLEHKTSMSHLLSGEKNKELIDNILGGEDSYEE